MKHSIATDAVKLTTSKIITMTIQLVIVMLLSRFRTLEEYGTYSQLLMVVNLVTTIAMLGLPNSINFFLARADNDEQKQKFVSVYYTLSTILSLFTGLVLVLSTPLIVRYFENGLIKNFIYFLAIYPWTRIVLLSINHIYIIYKRTTQLMLFTILNSAFLLIIIIIVELFNWDFKMYMMLFVIVESIFTISVYFIVKNLAGKITLSIDKSLIIKIFEFSIPLGFASIVGTISIELGKLVIGKFYSAAEFAIYINAAKELPITIIATSFTAVLMPQLVRLLKVKKNEEAIALWGDASILSYIFICFFATGIFVYAPEVISLLYSDKFLPGVPVFRVFSVVLLLRFTYFGMILNSIGRTKLILYSSIGALVLNLLLNYPFYLIFGFIGPAIATLLSITLIQLLQLIATSNSIGIPFKKIFPWKTFGSITLTNAGLGCLFAFIKVVIPLEIMTGEITESIILGLVWGGVYLVLMQRNIKEKWVVLNAG